MLHLPGPSHSGDLQGFPVLAAESFNSSAGCSESPIIQLRRDTFGPVCFLISFYMPFNAIFPSPILCPSRRGFSLRGSSHLHAFCLCGYLLLKCPFPSPPSKPAYGPRKLQVLSRAPELLDEMTRVLPALLGLRGELHSRQTKAMCS